jgi:oryzin
MVGIKRFALSLSAILPVFSLPLQSHKDVIPGKYIITLKPGLLRTQVNSHLVWVNNVHSRSVSGRDTTGVNKIYTINDFKGYSGSFDEETISQIQQNEDASRVPTSHSPARQLTIQQVAAVEPDMIFHTTALTTESNAPWGLGSISHTTPNFTDYIYDNAAGEGTYAYIIDTGINAAHIEFEGRASLGYNAYPDSDFVDRQGHGTHTAGTIGSRAYGVAKKTSLISVKVFDWSGVSFCLPFPSPRLGEPVSSDICPKYKSTTEIVMDGYAWAVNNITASNRAANSVVSMSLGGPKSEAFNAAIKAAYDAGVMTVVAAGNAYDDADNYSPASAPEAVTVGAVDVANVKADWSNYGSLLDIFAPGVDVLSCWIGDGNDESERLDGTSMATPHVAGLVLYLKSVEGEKVASPAAVVERLSSLGTKGVVTEEGEGSVNLLAYNGSGA